MLEKLGGGGCDLLPHLTLEPLVAESCLQGCRWIAQFCCINPHHCGVCSAFGAMVPVVLEPADV